MSNNKNNIFFITESSPFGYNSSGLSSYKTSHLEILLKAYPEKTFIIIVVTMWRQMVFDPKCLDFLKAKYDNLGDIIICKDQLENSLKVYELITLKRISRYYYPNFLVDLKKIKELIQTYNPVGIWAEHLYPAILCSFTSIKYYYSHHDFLSKIYILRNNSLRIRLKSYLLKKLEIYALKRSTGIISGSKFEIEEIKKQNKKVIFLPTTYNIIDKNSLKEASTFDIIHLGTSSATSNRIGLINFLTQVIPALNNEGIKYNFFIIGNINTVYDTHKELFHQDNVKLLGFVDNLEHVLKAYQIHVIPYNEISGTRTRLTLALNYNQLLLSTYKGSSGFDKLISHENCILVNDLKEMTDAIIQLYRNKNLVKKISNNGRSMFEKDFSSESQKKVVKQFTKFQY